MAHSLKNFEKFDFLNLVSENYEYSFRTRADALATHLTSSTDVPTTIYEKFVSAYLGILEKIQFENVNKMALLTNKLPK